MGLLFRNPSAARDIFSGWLAEFGRIDEKKRPRLTIVRGIDRDFPHAYRVLVGGNPEGGFDDSKIVMVVQRICRMDSTSPIHLDGFLREYTRHERFILVPAYFTGDSPVPDTEFALGMLELNVRNAWEIGRNDPDCAGVLAQDNVIVPMGVEDPPVRELQHWKR